MIEGDVLHYDYERMGSTGDGQTGNVTFTITRAKESQLTFYSLLERAR